MPKKYLSSMYQHNFVRINTRNYYVYDKNVKLCFISKFEIILIMTQNCLRGKKNRYNNEYRAGDIRKL